MLYFNDCTTQEELKKRYRELCKKLHPDNGGNASDFIAMKKEFEKAASGEAWRTFRNAAGETYQRPAEDISETPAEFAAIIEKLVNLPGVFVEVCGTWLWITGNTKPHRDIIKQAGGRWSKNKAAWYIHRDRYRKKLKRTLSLDEIRNLYGSRTFEKREEAKLEAAG